MTPTQIANYAANKFNSKLPFIFSYKGKKSQYREVYNKETGETVYQRKYTVTNNFLNHKDNAKFRDMHMRMGLGSNSRSTYGNQTEFNSNVDIQPGSKGVILNPRYYYNNE